MCKKTAVLLLLLAAMLLGAACASAAVDRNNLPATATCECGESGGLLYIDTEPTCTQQGLATYACPNCVVNLVKIKALGHNWHTESEDSPTCIYGGSRVYRCSR